MILEQAARPVDARLLKPLAGPRRFELSEIADAHRYFESGKATGKVVIDVAKDR